MLVTINKHKATPTKALWADRAEGTVVQDRNTGNIYMKVADPNPNGSKTALILESKDKSIVGKVVYKPWDYNNYIDVTEMHFITEKL